MNIEEQIQQKFEEIMSSIEKNKTEMLFLTDLVDWYRSKNGELERCVSKTYRALKSGDIDRATDLLRDEYDAIMARIKVSQAKQ